MAATSQIVRKQERLWLQLYLLTFAIRRGHRHHEGPTLRRQQRCGRRCRHLLLSYVVHLRCRTCTPAWLRSVERPLALPPPLAPHPALKYTNEGPRHQRHAAEGGGALNSPQCAVRRRETSACLIGPRWTAIPAYLVVCWLGCNLSDPALECVRVCRRQLPLCELARVRGLPPGLRTAPAHQEVTPAQERKEKTEYTVHPVECEVHPCSA